MPDLNEDSEEIRRNNVKNELFKVFMNYREENCDNYGNVRENNLSKEQLKEIKNLKEKINNKSLFAIKLTRQTN